MPAEPRRVLVVDDDEPIRILLDNVFRDAGYEVLVAPDGETALDMVGSWKPHLMTLDLVMPDLDGWGVLERLRRLPHPPPVVIVSACSDEVPPGVLDRYVGGCVTKPFHVADLLVTCQRVLTGNLGRPAPSSHADRRREPRRRFLVEATILAPDGTPLAIGMVTELSIGGVKLDLPVPIQPGSLVRVAFRLPGHRQPVDVSGRVRWREGLSLGLSVEEVGSDGVKIIQGIVGSGE
jgi:CheY-like chemotaxis protein